MTLDISRRRLLQAGAAGAAGAAAASLLPPSLRAALAEPAPEGGLDAVEHVVLLMQENRSFDHYFGTLQGVRGFGDRNAVRLRDGRSVFEQGTKAAPVPPFSVRAAAERQNEDLQYIGDLDHSWDGGRAAWNDGWMDGWTGAKTAATMAHYDRADIPFQFELADTFTVCDAYFSSIHTSTSPNRNHWVSGWTGFEADGRRAVGNDAYDEGRHPGYDWTTYPEHLQKAGVSWRVYQEWDNFTDNNLDFFASFKAVARKALSKAGGYSGLTEFYGEVADLPEEEQKEKLALLEEGVEALSDDERELYERGLRRGRPGSLAEAFRADVEAGSLPRISYLVPNSGESEHPSVSSPVHSATITYKVLDALASSPEVWKKTAVIISFDENDGFFDHVPPPVPPPGVEEEHWQGAPTGLGIRVPLLVVSPWTVGGYVCSEVFDHTSQVRFLERLTGVEAPAITAWRRSVCGDLTGAFDFSRGRPQPGVAEPGEIPEFTGRWRPLPPAEGRIPEQEPGTRPARPLPYQPDLDGEFDPEAREVALSASNDGASGVHMALFPYGGEFDAPQHRDVAPGAEGEEWTVPVSGDGYDFTVVGPNGFRREFAGSAEAGAPGSAAGVRTRVHAKGRRLAVTLANSGDAELEFTLTPNAYTEGAGKPAKTVRVAPGAEHTENWPTSPAEGWYDLTVAVAGDDAFLRRMAGHIENGKESVTG
ncbi:phospholipase C, phosphocholine-specific [Nocardiopsis sp. RSe5-2]|uniref:phospholipase C n=1 Tax=Nocardiopsis endophytica TaxID=3018445 RepID=A0ABT4U9Z2_9ACTN|nr:phospholipase C, phosphocholine-specific [Nocardiopsis endophytica]MDA2813200.1 phospholipase C, phosphocholine-specific [Nocardiopsis endophytica]